MLRNSGRPFASCHCIAQVSRTITSARPQAGRLWLRQRCRGPAFQRHMATVHSSNQDAYNNHNEPRSPSTPTTRQKLKEWEKLNAKQAQTMTLDAFSFSTIFNNMIRSQSTDSFELDNLRSAEESEVDTSDMELVGEHADTSINVHTRNPGDLVELRQMGSRTPILAVYLGFYGTRNHFYGSNGRWITSLGFSPHFTVSNFMAVEDLESVLSKIPLDATTPEVFDKMRQDRTGPSKLDGAHIIARIGEFRTLTERLYQDNLNRLDKASMLLADPIDVRYLSLFDMAEILLPQYLKDSKGYPPHALYAVHIILSLDELTFRPLSPSADCHRRDHIFEILPRRQIKLMDRVALMVREYTDLSIHRERPLTPSEASATALGQFINIARSRVLDSRQNRDWTPHGTLYSRHAVSLSQTKWSKAEQEIIHFLEWWASYHLFEPKSRYHATGAIILRALDLYHDAPLNQTTAWTLLQELNVISPWEIPSRYKVRFPEVTVVRGGGLKREVPRDIRSSRRPDIAAGARKDWGNTSVFCIDAPTTTVIDDGVSLERTENQDEFWIHIHTADPASVIRPDSELCKFMELIPENLYLPGHFQAMLPSEIGEESTNDYESQSLIKEFSLRPKGTALTFSAKVNRAGEILDSKVEPGVINNVLYLDPKDVSSFCNEPSPPVIQTTTLTVGNRQAAPFTPERPMVAAQDLEAPDKEDILQLYQLAEAIRNRRLGKGAWPYFFPRPSVDVTMKAVHDSAQTKESVTVPEPPYIQVGYDSSMGCSVVSNTMVLAGEIAARWCSSRGIPIPYRRDANLGRTHDTALEMVNNEMYPLIARGVDPSASQRQKLTTVTGGIELATSPGPYFLLGLDMYAKATSPLRRYADLVVHWQIHAALAHERLSQTPMEYTDEMDVLPFTNTSLTEALPLLQIREKMARTVSRGVYEWILLALVRAWKFEKSTPPSFVFTVDYRYKYSFHGRIDYFDLQVMMDLEGLNDVVLQNDIMTGDQFEVELVQVNVHTREIVVKALKYLRGDAKKVPSSESLAAPA